MQYVCLKANRECLGGVCPIPPPLPGRQIDLQKSLRRSICFIIFFHTPASLGHHQVPSVHHQEGRSTGLDKTLWTYFPSLKAVRVGLWDHRMLSLCVYVYELYICVAVLDFKHLTDLYESCICICIYSCSYDLHQAPQWAIRYGTSQNMYQ